VIFDLAALTEIHYSLLHNLHENMVFVPLFHLDIRILRDQHMKDEDFSTLPQLLEVS
jgi:hypothetical protein